MDLQHSPCSKMTLAATWRMDYKTDDIHRNSSPHEERNDSGNGKKWMGSKEY